MDLTSRQQKLLLTIIKEFTDSAEAVGSISLQSKYHFDLSPATIRNEMAVLVLHRYLFQKHNSGGRIPTIKGWRYFINTLKNSDLDDDVKKNILATLRKSKPNYNDIIRQAISQLTKISGNPTVAIINDEIFYAGLSEIILIPEFQEQESLRNILKLMEDYVRLSEIMNKGNADEEINILIGEEADSGDFEDYAVIFSEIRLDGTKQGYIAVLGPNRMNYAKIIPAVKYISDSIRNLL